MDVTFECTTNSARENKVNFNPRFIMEKIIPILETRPDIKSVKFNYDGYYTTLYFYLYNDKDVALTLPDRGKNAEYYQSIVNEIWEEPEFRLNSVGVGTRGWGELYISVELKR